MNTKTMSIGELADAAGLSRRAVRFYVQRGLVPPPLARGRGASYDRTHLDRLQHVLQLQDAGHSLAAIARILDEQQPSARRGFDPRPTPLAAAPPGAQSAQPAPPASDPNPASDEPHAPFRMQSQLVVRLRFAEGVELHLDATRFNPDARDLVELRQSVLSILKGERS